MYVHVWVSVRICVGGRSNKHSKAKKMTHARRITIGVKHRVSAEYRCHMSIDNTRGLPVYTEIYTCYHYTNGRTITWHLEYDS